jgi:hypothetical protein
MQQADTTVAALYVDTERGPYASMDGVDAYGIERDARLYQGPHPVVAHPPCEAWGQMRAWRLANKAVADWQSDRWDIAGASMVCGPVAVRQVQTLGGVLEHPARSSLWKYAGLPMPGLFTDHHGGFTVEVAQGAYGHPAPKMTWLYIVGVARERVTPRAFVDPGGRVDRQWSTDRHLTPQDFADWLVEIARGVTHGAS